MHPSVFCVVLHGMGSVFVASWSIYPNPWKRTVQNSVSITRQKELRQRHSVQYTGGNPFKARNHSRDSYHWRTWKRTNQENIKSIPKNERLELNPGKRERFYVWNGDLNWQSGVNSHDGYYFSKNASTRTQNWNSEPHERGQKENDEFFNKLPKNPYLYKQRKTAPTVRTLKKQRYREYHKKKFHPEQQSVSDNDGHPLKLVHFRDRYRKPDNQKNFNEIIIGKHNCRPPDLSRDPCLSRTLTVGSSGRIALPLKCNKNITKKEWLGMPRIMFPGAKPSNKYCLIMVDPDAPTPDNNYMEYWLHYLITDIAGYNIIWGDLIGNVVADFKSPAPPSGTHRYQFYLFEQKCNMLKLPGDFDLEKRENFPLKRFVKMNDFCEPEATYQYLVAPLEEK